MPTGFETFKDERFEQAVAAYSADSWVYLHATKQLGLVEEVRPSADGPRPRIRGIGGVPVEDIRSATAEEIREL